MMGNRWLDVHAAAQHPVVVLARAEDVRLGLMSDLLTGSRVRGLRTILYPPVWVFGTRENALSLCSARHPC
jgi:hypothetical protein